MPLEDCVNRLERRIVSPRVKTGPCSSTFWRAQTIPQTQPYNDLLEFCVLSALPASCSGDTTAWCLRRTPSASYRRPAPSYEMSHCTLYVPLSALTRLLNSITTSPSYSTPLLKTPFPVTVHRPSAPIMENKAPRRSPLSAYEGYGADGVQHKAERPPNHLSGHYTPHYESCPTHQPADESVQGAYPCQSRSTGRATIAPEHHATQGGRHEVSSVPDHNQGPPCESQEQSTTATHQPCFTGECFPSDMLSPLSPVTYPVYNTMQSKRAGLNSSKPQAQNRFSPQLVSYYVL